MYRPFRIANWFWCGNKCHVYYMLWGWLPIRIISNVPSHRAVEVCCELRTLQTGKKVPNYVRCVWCRKELKELSDVEH